MAKQGEGTDPEHVRGRLVPGDQQQVADTDQLLIADGSPVLLDDPAQHAALRELAGMPALFRSACGIGLRRQYIVGPAVEALLEVPPQAVDGVLA